MPNTYSTMALHFRYRMWIAEMNADITMLRIFNDYMAEITAKNGDPILTIRIDKFQQQFFNLRKENDELRHEMHLSKMTLAADSRENKKNDYKLPLMGNHAELIRRYAAYRKVFDSLKKEFGSFEGKWL